MKFTFRTEIIYQREISLPSRLEKLALKEKSSSKALKESSSIPSDEKDTRFKKKYKEESNEIIYFECTKLGHMKAECPQLKKMRYFGDKKRKV
ncbi:hypothetical protein GmHk_05G012807 [Glycine max]|nr:hypothetical protein GmHk_05G012807 [Glycine max]